MNDFKMLRYILAGSTARRARSLYRLARSKNTRIRIRVAENSSCPVSLLAILSDDVKAEVRMAVALNPSCSDELRRLLSRDANPDVRFRIASTAYMPLSILSELVNDDNPYVQARAVQTLNRIAQQNGMKRQRVS